MQLGPRTGHPSPWRWAALAACLVACAPPACQATDDAPPTQPTGCPRCGEPRVIGRLQGGELTEASGLASSATHAGVVWSHNDSGGSARVFAVSGAGLELGQFVLTGALAVDWEDLAKGPCGARTCLFVGDTGDNRRRRSSYAVHRLQEPATPTTSGATEAEWLAFTYPGGSRNCEALLVHPGDGQITLVTKADDGDAEVFVLPQPWVSGSTVEATLAGTVAPPSKDEPVTGGDVHPTGRGVLLRTYDSLGYYAVAEGQSVAQALTSGAQACAVPVADEDQGEAVAFLPDGSGYLTLGEGAYAPIYQVDCEGW